MALGHRDPIDHQRKQAVLLDRRLSALKRGYGLDRTRLDGLDGARTSRCLGRRSG